MIVYPLVPGQPVVLEFLPPAHPMNMNDRTHWRAYARQRGKWRAAAGAAVLAADLDRLPPADIHVELPVPGNRRRDPHNWYPTVKHIVDGLVDAGVWPDDTPEYLTTHEPTLRSCTRAELATACVRITIIPRVAT